MASRTENKGPLVPFGAPMRHAHFAFAPTYTPLNHGSYGTHPVSVRAAHLALRAEVEMAPDPFIALDFHERLAAPRARVAQMLGCARADEIVFVPNATTGIDTVMKNVAWRPGDIVMCYDVVYESVWFAMLYLQERYGVEAHMVRVGWPVSDDELVERLVGAARDINARPGKRVRMAVLDTIVSGPGARVPFERLVPALQAEGALVLVDGAHGIGHIDIDLDLLKPDFFVTNLHKWLFVPRGCAAFYVPRRNQDMIRTTLPTSHGFRPRIIEISLPAAGNVLRADKLFEIDDHTNNLQAQLTPQTGSVSKSHRQAALKFRSEVCGGETAIQEYCISIARRAGDMAAEILGTDVMDIPGSCMRQCNFANVRMPLEVKKQQISSQVSNDGDDDDLLPETWDGSIDPKYNSEVQTWIRRTGCEEVGIYFQVFPYRDSWWWRLSGMIYVEEEDFRKGALALKGLCERVRKGEFLHKKHGRSLGGSSSSCSPIFTPISDEFVL